MWGEMGLQPQWPQSVKWARGSCLSAALGLDFILVLSQVLLFCLNYSLGGLQLWSGLINRCAIGVVDGEPCASGEVQQRAPVCAAHSDGSAEGRRDRLPGQRLPVFPLWSAGASPQPGSGQQGVWGPWATGKRVPCSPGFRLSLVGSSGF